MVKKTKVKKLDDTSLNCTCVYFMCNSNIVFHVKQSYEQFKEDITDIIWDILFDEELQTELKYVFGQERFIREIEVLSFGVEIGPEQGRGHFNLSVKIMHCVPRYSLSKLRKRLQKWLNAAYPD